MEGEYYHTKESVEEYVKLAGDVSGKELIEQFNNFLKPNSKVLEIGSGPGTDWKLLNERYSVVGSDNSSEFLNHLRNAIPEGEFALLDAVELNTDRSFDGIYSNKVLHHLSNKELVKSIQRQYEILQPSGIICHSFWKGEGDEIFKGLFVNYHIQSEIRELFAAHFEILILKEYAEFEENDSILIIARKK
jgi:cyclopropane fatty-acyl-phospholipid synthase-like methyltransferase